MNPYDEGEGFVRLWVKRTGSLQGSLQISYSALINIDLVLLCVGASVWARTACVVELGHYL